MEFALNEKDSVELEDIARLLCRCSSHKQRV